MTEEKTRKLRKIYAIALGVFTVIVGVLFIAQALSIYTLGPAKPYTKDLVAEKLLQIAVPIFIWIAAVIGGGVIWMIFPPERQKLVAPYDNTKTLKKLESKLPENLLGDSSLKRAEAVKKSKRNLKLAWGICGAVCLAVLIYGLIYLFGMTKTEVTQDVLKMLLHIGPWIILGFACVIAAVIYTDVNAKGQIKEIKAIIAENAKLGNVKKVLNESKQKRAWYSFIYKKQFKTAIQIAVCAVGVTFIIVGIFNGGAQQLLIKAINICMECVGLG